MCLCVCLFVTIVGSAKIAEPISVLFGVYTQVGPRNLIFGGCPDPQRPVEGAIWGHILARCKLQRASGMWSIFTTSDATFHNLFSIPVHCFVKFFYILLCFSFKYFSHYCMYIRCLQCFDAVGWAARF